MFLCSTFISRQFISAVPKRIAMKFVRKLGMGSSLKSNFLEFFPTPKKLVWDNLNIWPCFMGFVSLLHCWIQFGELSISSWQMPVFNTTGSR